jgi:hypothetical protein
VTRLLWAGLDEPGFRYVGPPTKTEGVAAEHAWYHTDLAQLEAVREQPQVIRLQPFSEHRVPHADGELRRLELSDDQFLLVDVVDGAPTLNWTASIGARQFALLVSERINQFGGPEESAGEIMISMAGSSDQFDARLGVQLAASASPDFDQRSEFIRFDGPDIALALQSVPGDVVGEQVKLFGVSAMGLSLDTAVSLMARTATRGLAAHARAASTSLLIARMAELVHLHDNTDSALGWRAASRVEGEATNEQA